MSKFRRSRRYLWSMWAMRESPRIDQILPLSVHKMLRLTIADRYAIVASGLCWGRGCPLIQDFRTDSLGLLKLWTLFPRSNPTQVYLNQIRKGQTVLRSIRGQYQPSA